MKEQRQETQPSPDELIAQFEMCIDLSPHPDGTPYVLLSNFSQVPSKGIRREIVKQIKKSGGKIINDLDDTQIENITDAERIQRNNIEQIRQCIDSLPYTQSFRDLQLSRTTQTLYSWITPPTIEDRKRLVSYYSLLFQIPDERRQDIECYEWRAIVKSSTNTAIHARSIQRTLETLQEKPPTRSSGGLIQRVNPINMNTFRNDIKNTYGIDPSQTSEELY